MITVLRSGCLIWPSLLLFGLIIWRRPDARLAGAAGVALLWNLSALLALNDVALLMEWWSYSAHGGLIHGMPGELLIGWAMLWGAIPILAFRSCYLWQLIVAALFLDLLVMPACAPLIQLGPHWLLGEAVALVIALIPSLFLGRCIQFNRYLKARVALLVIGFTALIFFVIPTFLLEQSSGSWGAASARPVPVSWLILSCVFFAAIPALSAVQEFCERGQGTPLPFDPPRRMVTSGPYAYITNPMQTGSALVLLLWGWWACSLWVSAAAIVSIIISIGIAGWHESNELETRFGDVWTLYRAEVRNWLPRLRPRVLIPCKIYVARSCDPCSQLADWLKKRQPIGLVIIEAEKHPTRNLHRITYEAPGWSEEGLAAFARALEHLHLGWAWIGWMLRLPIVCPVLQWLLDLSGGGPRKLTLPS